MRLCVTHWSLRHWSAEGGVSKQTSQNEDFRIPIYRYCFPLYVTIVSIYNYDYAILEKKEWSHPACVVIALLITVLFMDTYLSLFVVYNYYL